MSSTRRPKKRRVKRLGIGAKCEVIKRFLHSRKDVMKKYPDSEPKHVTGLNLLRLEMKQLNKSDK